MEGPALRRTTRSREEVETGRRDRHLMNVANERLPGLPRSRTPLVRVAASAIASDGVGAPSDGVDLDEASRLIRSLLARAEHLDDLWSQHGLELAGFRGALAARFEKVECAVAELVRTRLPADLTGESNGTSDGDRAPGQSLPARDLRC